MSVYYAIAAPHYRVFAAIFGPLLLYTGFGLVPRWKGARLIAIIMISITLLLAVLTLVSMYFLDLSDEYGQDDLLRFTALNGVRIIVLPFVLFYLFGKRVRAYYSRSNY